MNIHKEKTYKVLLLKIVMVIKYKKGFDVPIEKLDELFLNIGWNPRGEKRWAEVLSKSYFMYTAWNGQTLVGMGRIMEDGVMCMFYDIGVHPKYQHQGIGSKILQTLIDAVKNKKYASIGLFAWSENPISKPFYRKFGFVEKKTGMELDKYMIPE
jgi:ribosomal protein S18 acetylase RimI-like enzyme